MNELNIQNILECVLLLKDNVSNEELINFGMSENIIKISNLVYKNINYLLDASLKGEL